MIACEQRNESESRLINQLTQKQMNKLIWDLTKELTRGENLNKLTQEQINK